MRVIKWIVFVPLAIAEVLIIVIRILFYLFSLMKTSGK